MSTEARIPTPIEVIETMDMAANHSDLVNIESLFTDDATITLQPPIPGFEPRYQGKDQIHNFLKNLITKDFQVQSSNFRVAGNEVTWDTKITADRFRQMGIDKAEITDHAELWGALIHSWTLQPGQQLQQKVQAGMAAQGSR